MDSQFNHIYSECRAAALLATDFERVRALSIPALLHAGMTLARGIALAQRPHAQSGPDDVEGLKAACRIIVAEIRGREVATADDSDDA